MGAKPFTRQVSGSVPSSKKSKFRYIRAPKLSLSTRMKSPGSMAGSMESLGDGIEIHHKQPEHRCNQQRNDNDGDVLQQGFDELFHDTGYFSSKIFFLYNSHICELVAGFPDADNTICRIQEERFYTAG